MNNIATATETGTVVRIGKGLHLHMPMKGIKGVAAACGTVSRTFGAERKTTGVVTCQKCLDQQAAEAAYYAEQEEAAAAAEAEVHTALLLEDAVNQIAAETEARRTEAPAQPIEFTPEVVAEAMADIDAHNLKAFAKGDKVRTKDGAEYTVRRINANGSVRLIAADGTKVTRSAKSLIKL